MVYGLATASDAQWHKAAMVCVVTMESKGKNIIWGKGGDVGQGRLLSDDPFLALPKPQTSTPSMSLLSVPSGKGNHGDGGDSQKDLLESSREAENRLLLLIPYKQS